jgi:hypothetical protein
MKKKLLDASKSANSCQRNWSNTPIAKNIIRELAEIATNMPTKQNQQYYTLLCSTDPKYNHFVYSHSYAPTEEALAMPFEDRHKLNYNTQMRAPLLFQWFSETTQEFTYSDYWTDGLLSIGVSSGAVALAANKMGLKTGFCVCVHQEPVVEAVNKKYKTKFDRLSLSLGIGYPLEGYEHNIVIWPDGEEYRKTRFEKAVKYIIQ